MLEIRPIMNTPTEAIFEFKSCCNIRAFDQNLEILVTNRSDGTVAVPSYFDLKTEQESRRIETLMPHGEQRIPPGETIAFYCTMDEKQWNAAKQMVFYDSEGKHYSVDLDDSGVKL
ncbi:MAG: hypothetical protein PVJ69_17670 [Desulfobacteraceae bacterium]|jgi:hypothetical protein